MRHNPHTVAARRPRLVAVLASAVLLLVACGEGQGTGTEPGEEADATDAGGTAAPDQAAASYPVGIVAPLSGGAADYGNAFVNGVQLAIDDINEAGGITVDGQNVTLEPVTCDDAFESDQAVSCARRVVGQDGANVVMTPSSLAAFPMMGFNEAEEFIVMATSQTPSFTEEGNELVIRFINNTDRTMDGFVELLRQFADDQGYEIDALGVMEVNTELGQSWVANFTQEWEAAGGTVTGRATYDANDTDFYGQLSTILADDPDAIVLTTVCQPSANVIEQARELGFEGRFINSAACSGEELVSIIPDLADGVMFESATWAFPDPEVLELKDRYRDEFGEEPQFITGVGYEGTRWLAASLEEAGTLDDVHAIKSAFAPALDGLDNMFDMSDADEDGDLDFPMYVGYIQDGEVLGFRGDELETPDS